MAYQANVNPNLNVHAANVQAQPDVQHHAAQENVNVNPQVVDIHGAAPGTVHATGGWFSSMFLNVEAERGLLDTYCYAIIAAAAVTYIVLHFLPSAYGRYASRAFGILIPGRIAWFLQDLPAVVVPILVFLRLEHTQLNAANYLLLGLFIASYIQRSVVYPLLIRGGKPVPSVPFLIALVYNTANGYVQARYLTRFAYYGPLWVVSVNFLAGMVMFAMGFYINLQSDSILRGLRSPLSRGGVTTEASDSETIGEAFDKDLGLSKAGPGGPMPSNRQTISRTAVGNSNTAGYKIPYGGMFEFVSCANFFGEIVEWWGFAMACWSLPALAHALFTMANLIPRGLQHHQDYLTKFKGEYPKSRSAVIPYII